jgi:HD-GYP domain-containing protein (c-di-GMP phosphodiesterase class II)
VETQTPHPLSVRTRDDARAALARAFEEAATMPGTLLPIETLDELRAMAARIHDEVMSLDDRDIVFGSGMPPWAYIVEHSIDATVVGLVVGRRLLPEDALGDLATGLFLQDIGKLALPESIVQKPGPLAPDEWDLMMKHPVLGLAFLKDDSISPAAKCVVRSHHERWDGSGYPGALIGDEISLFARIAAVADVFDAVTSERWHAPAVPPAEGVEIVRAGTGTAFDPAVVDAFTETISPR